MIANLIAYNQLQPADVIVAKKRNGLGRILNHYIVYTGDYSFMGNLKDGVKWISPSELVELLMEYEPIRIRRFRGSYLQRQQALQRAYSRLGQRYRLFSFNCEHFANWVQKGSESSTQVTVAISTVLAALVFKFLNNNNDET